MITDAGFFRKQLAEELYEAICGIDQSEIDELIQLIVKGRRIFVTGAGQSLLMMKVLGMMLVQNGFTAYVVGDAATPSLQEGDVLIAASSSGTTKSTRLFVEKAKALHGKIGLFTATESSPMADIADAIVMIRHASDGGNGRESVSYEGDGFIQTLLPLVHCIARLAGERIGSSEEVTIRNHANIE